MQTLFTAIAVTFSFMAIETARSQVFSEQTRMYFEPRGDSVPASFCRVSPDKGELKWQSVPGYAYIIEEGEFSRNDWRTYATVIASNEKETTKEVLLEPGAHFFRVRLAPAYPAGDFAGVGFYFEPYIPGWVLATCGAEWRWSNGYVAHMGANYQPWRGLYSKATPLLLALIVTAPDSSSITGLWAMTITNITSATNVSAKGRSQKH